MPLRDVLTRLAINTGLSVTTDRPYLLTLINQAAIELWEASDVPGCTREVILTVQANTQVTLPAFIGEPLAMREYNLYNKVQLVDMRPRYSYNPWAQQWNNWRIKQVSPIHTQITNAGILTFVAAAVETPNAAVTVTGSTANSSLVTETVSLTGVSVNGTQQFETINSITAAATRLYDIAVRDMNGNELAVLANNELETKYTIMDISQYPFSSGVSSYIEVLYKAAFQQLVNDGDTMPAPGLDGALFYKAMTIWCALQDGKTEETLKYANMYQAAIARLQDSASAVEKFIQFAPNPMFELTRMAGPTVWRDGAIRP